MKLSSYLNEFEYSFEFLKSFINGKINEEGYDLKTISRVLCNSNFLSVIKKITNNDQEAMKEYAEIIIKYFAPQLSKVVEQFGCYITYDPNNVEIFYILNNNDYVLFYIDIFNNQIVSLALPDSYEFQEAFESTLREYEELADLKQSILVEDDYRNTDGKLGKITGYLGRYDNVRKIKEKTEVINRKMEEVRENNTIFNNAINELFQVYKEVIEHQNVVLNEIRKEFGFRTKRAKNLEISNFQNIFDFMKEQKEVLFYEDI